MNEKRDIKSLIQQEETHLNNLLEPNIVYITLIDRPIKIVYNKCYK
jgi:hypothetical protein